MNQKWPLIAFPDTDQECFYHINLVSTCRELLEITEKCLVLKPQTANKAGTAEAATSNDFGHADASAADNDDEQESMEVEQGRNENETRQFGNSFTLGPVGMILVREVKVFEPIFWLFCS